VVAPAHVSGYLRRFAYVFLNLSTLGATTKAQ
jgi:hypothetical protein